MNEIDWKTIDIKIKNIKQPLVFIFLLIKKKDLCSDDDMALLLRYYLKYHSNIALKYNLLILQDMLENYPISLNILIDFYGLIKRQIKLLQILKHVKKAYNKKFFWRKNINEQILLLKNTYQNFRAIYDCSKGPLIFFYKLKIINDKNTKIHINEMIYRLRLVYKLFNFKFFQYYKILIIYIDDFNNMKFENKVKYIEYIFVKINKILINYINYFELYNSFRMELDNLLNPKPINIEIDIIESEIENDDINFFLGIE